MIPELEVALTPIGWERVKVIAPHEARRLALHLNTNGGLVAFDAHQARKSAKQIETLERDIASVLIRLQGLTDDARTTVNLVSTSPEERNGGWPDHVGAAISSLTVLSPGLECWRDQLKRLGAEEGGRGRPTNLAVRSIAFAVAEIFVIGTGRKPTFRGKSGSDLFAKTVKAVIDALGLRHVETIDGACQWAVEQLDEGRMARLLDLHNGAEHQRHLSLFDVAKLIRSEP
ncbi:hypothetical protein SAMN05877809_10580 [Rhodobacter sp. JA431]|uniref:hypothetical protein n=1 Tax=Rhodobacter sp. JA431 TaxID=570013 RepID=UPI000BC6E450|nr:hypothetical protein [Rhodobacter sp. JA431]SOC10181.1 hypothetical protein SAMN05877809_10580 [Rhodobacter sp. JA431]